MPSIPVMKPRLPSAERLAPYLKAIDSSRMYTNYGPLALSLEDRLAAHFGLPNGTIATVANATLGLTLALTAQGARPGTLCAMPAWTFVASAHAALMAGLVPFFLDVDPETWTLDPRLVPDAEGQAPAPIGAVMPISAFGQPIDVTAWDRVASRSGLPMAIDAAAGFDSFVPGAIPAVISLHATKVLGVGEGGFVVSTDTALIREIRTRANFGFRGSRDALVPGTNAKLSEYHAAVGHAALDEWSEVRSEWMLAGQHYRTALSALDDVWLQDDFGKAWVASTCVVRFGGGVEGAQRALEAAGIETRRWWGAGAHAHPATAAFPRAPLPATEALAGSTLGLPFFRDLTVAEIDRIVSILVGSARS
jgi:dTDP-4-amino-4,6-dideoxygalactose transaminase